jgi:molybdopterin/thiamine biosynthesis adenylyltransferase
MSRGRDARNIALFGVDGQRAIERTAVGLVGYGGLGSHVGQQLAYLGTAHVVVIDHDIVEVTNLNRLVGAIPTDAQQRTPKVQVAARTVTAIRPEASVRIIQAKVDAPEAIEALQSVDVVIGAVDNDITRLALLEMCSERAVPYMDAATDTHELDDGRVLFGGRVYVCRGDGCLHCSNELDPDELVQAAMTPDQRDAHDRIYGIDRRLVGASGPMVVSVNGVIASIAVTEFMVMVTGLRQPVRHLIYKGESGIVVMNADAPPPSCYYCTRWREASNR